MPTTTTKTYPMAFTANAFLMPKHAKRADLFELASDEQMLRKLKPSAETVRAAILECKKHGLQASFSGGLALTISGEASVLHVCFGVRLVFDSSQSTETEWFEDETGNKQDQPKPVAGHPLGNYIVSLSSNPCPDFNWPKYPGKTNDWEKKENYHIWPHQLRERLSVNTKQLNAIEVNNINADIQGGNPFCIALVDSGLNGSHPYFSYPEIGLQNDINDRNFPMVWPEVDELTVGDADLYRNALDTDTELTNLLSYTVSIKQALWDKYFIYQGPPAQNVVLRPQALADPNLDALRSEIAGLKDSRFYKDYVASDPAFTKPLVTLLDNVTKCLLNSAPIWSGTDLNWTVMYHQFVALEELLKIKQNKLHIALRWIRVHGKKDVDIEGHGTGMAASMLGVSRKAHVASFPALAQNSAKVYKEVIGRPPVLLETVFKAAAKWCKIKDLNVKGRIKLGLTIDPNQPVDYKTISNSYVRNLPISGLKNEDLNDWGKLIRDWVEKDNFSILFSAGNSGNPPMNSVSLFALLGHYGAIIVGGAWDYDRTIPNQADPYISLATAAHGLNVKLKTGVLTSKTITIPDICGFVGDDLNIFIGNPPQPISPYVYIPTTTTQDGWGWYGGGTSSACAQVAALCGALRAKYPNHSALQIKQAIMKGGDPVTKGKSYQGNLPDDPTGKADNVLKDQPNLVNILGAYSEAEKIKPAN